MINNHLEPKSQVPNNDKNQNSQNPEPKDTINNQNIKNHKFDLEDRTLAYSIKVMNKLKEMPINN